MAGDLLSSFIKRRLNEIPQKFGGNARVNPVAKKDLVGRR